jgi:O-antigen/teichoic acid export membrane protein
MPRTRDAVQPGDAPVPEGPAFGAIPDGPSLRVQAARGTLVNAGFTVGLHTVGLLKTFVIAAFLSKSEYGVWSVLVITLGTLGWLKEAGIVNKYVQQDELDQETAFQKAFTIDFLSNVALFAVMVVALPLFALAYGQWEIVLPGLVIAAVVPAQSIRAPAWIFYRQMRYARQRLLEALDPLASLVVTVVLAAAGMGYWSLVIGFVAGVFISAAGAVAVSPIPLRFRYDRATLAEYFSFSWPVLVATGSGLLVPQVAMLVGTRELGLAGAGIIGLAGSVGVYAQKVDELVTRTLYPAICRVKDRTELLYEVFVKSNRLALMWGVPFGVAVALFAPDVIPYVMGEKWRPAIGLVQAYGLIAAVNHIGFNWKAFFMARGETRPMAVAGPVTLCAFLLTAVPGMIVFELEGFAAGMAAMTGVLLCLRAYYLTRLFPGFQMLLYGLRAITPTIPAVAATLALRAAGSGRSPSQTIVEGAVYVGVTILCTWLLERPLLREAVGYVRGRAQPGIAVPA